MTTARKQLVSVEATPYYHCVSRCVRQSFLCGKDITNNISYEHRKDWIETKLQTLSKLYCIDICAYAIMSNHYHLVIHLNKDKAENLSPFEVVERWGLEHNLPNLIMRWKSGQIECAIEEAACLKIIEQWRERLWCLSWFMKELNYDIACRANDEDNCRGHFWESRYKSQALLDEKALIAAMVYVDLNPVRAGIVDTPEASDFTSIKARIARAYQGEINAPCLYPFVGDVLNEAYEGVPLILSDYIELVDWSARHIRQGKASVSEQCPPILERLQLHPKEWIKVCTQLGQTGRTAVGDPNDIQALKSILGKNKICLYRLQERGA
ncbi:transposase [Vibrio gallicus]|uniref:transposase n=1 Tax=Vibrio gallicus TaxID=190897 RepID=UPI0021C3FE5D|nr:transposase [Vibrio gallicus]